METTAYLAQLWGPAILAVGIGVFINRHNYIKVYRELERDTLAVLLFGMVAMIAGVAHVLAHNVWGSFMEGLISFLGWALLAKGTMFIMAPKFVDKAGDYWAHKKLIPVAGLLTLAAGIYLVWLGYFA
jgi:ABC-type enterobactin transport system permease subunit